MNDFSTSPFKEYDDIYHFKLPIVKSRKELSHRICLYFHACTLKVVFAKRLICFKIPCFNTCPRAARHRELQKRAILFIYAAGVSIFDLPLRRYYTLPAFPTARLAAASQRHAHGHEPPQHSHRT